jgi:hypothetical protein
MSEDTYRWKRVTILGWADERYELEIRALTFEEIYDLLRSARDTDWYGNRHLIEKVATAGVKGGLDLLGTSAYTDGLVARQIWIFTLRDIVARGKTICRGMGARIKPPRIRNYAYKDLATPGMLLRIAEKCNEFDVEGYTRAMVENCVADISVHGRIVDAEERAAWIDKVFEWVAQEILTMHGVDGTLTKTLPETVLPTFAHRFFAADLLFMTLDWIQFREAVHFFNRAVEAAIRRSHQLGGLDEQPGSSPLVTGIPLFFETVLPTRNLPMEIAPQLLYDARETPLKGFSRTHRTALKRAAQIALLSGADRIRSHPDRNAIPEDGQQEIIAAVLQTFVKEVSRFPRLVQSACTIHIEKFREHSNEASRHHLERARRAFRLLTPDTYFLCEGPSDKIYFAHFLDLLGTERAYVKVECREGSSTISRRVRDLLAEGVSSIATIVDADAAKEYAELKRLIAGLTLSDAFIFQQGAIEDQFSGEIHAAAINATYSEGPEVTAEDLRGEGDVVKRLSRVCWKKKSATFDKVAHAKSIVIMLQSADHVPSEVKTIIERIITFGKKSSQAPKVKSYLSFDAKTRDRLRRLEMGAGPESLRSNNLDGA